MYREIELLCTDGNTHKFEFLSTGTTAFRFKQIFRQDLMILLSRMEDDKNENADTGVGDKLAYVMNAQARKEDMSKLNFDSFLEWADQFDGAELFLHVQDFIGLYLGTRQTTSAPKNAHAQLKEK